MLTVEPRVDSGGVGLVHRGGGTTIHYHCLDLLHMGLERCVGSMAATLCTHAQRFCDSVRIHRLRGPASSAVPGARARFRLAGSTVSD